jgi:hypothetical protein
MKTVTMRDVQDTLEAPVREAELVMTYADYGELLIKVRKRIKAQFSMHYSKPKESWLYLKTFDLLCVGVSKQTIAQRLRISPKRLTQVLAQLYQCPAVRLLRRRLEGSPD